MPRILPARFLPLAAAFVLGGVFAGPAAAQDEASGGGGGEKVNQVIVYGDDACPQSQGDEITVCARKPEAERYRIPEPLRGIDTPRSHAWANRVQAYETVGKFGTSSCSPVGAGGFTGCTEKLVRQAALERKNGTDLKFGELIQKEREKRLATIDATAADEQARVEIEEDAYEARGKAGAATPAPQTTAAPQGQ